MLDLIASIAVCMVATWRISYMIASEAGPWDVFARLRTALPLGGLTSCLYCVSVWSAVLLWVAWQTPVQPAVIILAISGGALMLGSQTGANYRGSNG